MTMQIEKPATIVTDIPEVKQEEYVPSVADKIQRVLYRLDHGEELIRGCLSKKDKFCVLGLFADESGIGTWEDRVYVEESAAYIDDNNEQLDYDQILTYYGIKPVFTLENLPDHVISKIRYKFSENEVLSLPFLNDNLYGNADLNSILADVIRSGAIFE